MANTITARRRFVFSYKTCTICGALIVAMLILSQWQWRRHLQKRAFIVELEERLEEPVSEIKALAETAKDNTDKSFWSQQIHRRVKISGAYDYENELVIRNRRFQNFPGVHLFTPLKIAECNCSILVNRGFVPLPLAGPEQIKLLNRPTSTEFVGLIKESVKPSFFSPRDDQSGPGKEKVFSWLRPNLPAIASQLPYEILPIYAEIIQSPDGNDISENIISAKSGRDDIFFLPSSEKTVLGRDDYPKLNYPVPVFDTVIPAGRHLGYVFEWAAMAVMTALIGVVLQLRRQR